MSEPDVYSHRVPGRHHFPTLGSKDRADPPRLFGHLGHPFGSSFRERLVPDRASPPRLDDRLSRQVMDKRDLDFGKPDSFLRPSMSSLLSSTRELERQRHASSFLDRDKTAYFRPMTFDSHTRDRSSMLRPNYVDLTKDSPSRQMSPYMERHRYLEAEQRSLLTKDGLAEALREPRSMLPVGSSHQSILASLRLTSDRYTSS